MELAVFSLWTGTTNFKLDRSSALIFSAAIAFADEAFPDTELVTDIRGLEIADRLGWRLTSHSVALEGFCPEGAEHVWMLGKIRAQEVQTRPFAHIDLDFLLLGPLGPRLTKAPVSAQSKDHPRSYHDKYVKRIIAHCGITPHAVPYNTGMVLWNDLEFCRDYCSEAMALSQHAGKQFNHGGCISIVCEQLLLGDMARKRRVRVETAIPLPMHTHPEDMRDCKFVHYWADTKRDPKNIAKVEELFSTRRPVEYRRFLDGWPRLSPADSGRNQGTNNSAGLHRRPVM